MNIDKLITSSSDPAKVSATVKGIIVAILPLIIYFTGATEAEVNVIVDGLIQALFLGTTLYSTVMTVFGMGRKIYLARWSAVE